MSTYHWEIVIKLREVDQKHIYRCIDNGAQSVLIDAIMIPHRMFLSFLITSARVFA